MIGILLTIIIIVYLARDAVNRDKNPWVWGIFALFFSFLALGLYLYQTDRKSWGVVCIGVWVVAEIVNLSHGRLLL
jgi:Na+-transporting NADH:ubiquinone oxidoreductase subunit NqrB